MSAFWGYMGADTLAIMAISAMSALALFHARIFVSRL